MAGTIQRWAAAVEATAAILKRKFTNLTVEETIKLSNEIVVAVLDAVEEKDGK